MAFVDLLGRTLHTKTGEQSTEAVLAGKVVGLYFSAHWCPPCRGFTPKLAEIYNTMIDDGKNFEIVFVSSDKDQSSFDEYYSEMPWVALPFDERDTKGKLSSKFAVRSIPTLVILDEEGNLLTTDGREVVSTNPAGFPWKPKSVDELLGDELQGKDGLVSKADAIGGKQLALYFSAHWCPPCRAFTPKLIKLYNTIKETRNDVEFIFVSSDRDEGSFNEYFAEMPWLALPFSRREDKEALSRRFGVEGIPTLITVDENLNVINKSARGAAMEDTDGAKFPWFPNPVEELSKGVESNGFDVNEKPSLIVFSQGPNDEIAQALDKIAKEEPKGNPALIYFTASANAGPVPQVKAMTQLDKEFTGLLILDIPDNGGFYSQAPSEINEDSIRSFIEGYKSKTLTRKQMSQG